MLHSREYENVTDKNNEENGVFSSAPHNNPKGSDAVPKATSLSRRNVLRHSIVLPESIYQVSYEV